MHICIYKTCKYNNSSKWSHHQVHPAPTTQNFSLPSEPLYPSVPTLGNFNPFQHEFPIMTCQIFCLFVVNSERFQGNIDNIDYIDIDNGVCVLQFSPNYHSRPKCINYLMIQEKCFYFRFLNLIQIEDFDLLSKWMMIFAWFILEKPAIF